MTASIQAMGESAQEMYGNVKNRISVGSEGGSSISEKGAAIANGAYSKGGELATGAYQGASYAKHAALDWLTTMTASSANKSIDK